MKKRFAAFLAGFLVFLLVAVMFGFNTTGMATLFVQQQQNKVNYKIDGAENFIQCLDVEPENSVFEKGSCFTQLHKGSEVYGINTVDYCKSEKEVVDYYCSAGMICTEIVNECSDGFVCDGGRCIKKFKPFEYFDIRNLGNSFRSLFVKDY